MLPKNGEEKAAKHWFLENTFFQIRKTAPCGTVSSAFTLTKRFYKKLAGFITPISPVYLILKCSFWLTLQSQNRKVACISYIGVLEKLCRHAFFFIALGNISIVVTNREKEDKLILCKIAFYVWEDSNLKRCPVCCVKFADLEMRYRSP